MSSVPAMVIAGPGTNRDRDACDALEMAGAAATVVLASELTACPLLLDQYRLVVIAGGFSHADSLGAGRMLALDLQSGLGNELQSFIASGRPVIGICNGFQVLTQAGLLPGSLGHNESGDFDCRWVELDADPTSHCVWTAELTEAIHCPIAHGEGRFVHPDARQLALDGQVALRYSGINPNGSVADIAGVCDPTGVVLGLMPHPENHVVRRQHPRRRSVEYGRFADASTGLGLGLQLFANGVRHARQT
jgi:phosphoribosylformylglycinamidine synthase subunit PurQ / glutaminase